MILRKEIDSYNLHIEEIKKYANEHDLLKGKYFARYYINEGEIYNNVINGETIKFYEFSLRDYSFNFKTFNVAFGIIIILIVVLVIVIYLNKIKVVII